MPDMSAIATLISSFSAAQNITKGFLDLKSLGEVQAKVIELQSVIAWHRSIGGWWTAVN